MGSLQLWLAVLGGLVLAGVVAHGAWRASKLDATYRADPAPAPTQLREPSFDAPLSTAAAADALAAAPPRRAPAPGASLDALIDAIATITLEAPIAAELALAHLPPTRRVGSKPLAIEGLDADTGQWETVAPGAAPGKRYSELQAGVQLANRAGALNEIEYSEFVQKVQALADAIGGEADFPDMLDVVARARELDAFASQHDAQLAMRLHATGSAWSVGYLAQQAARHGFVAGVVPGRLVLPGSQDAAPPMLSLQFDPQAALAALADEPAQATVREATLMFDVPQTASEHEPFKAWCDAGRALAQSLQAQVFDDQGQPLSFDSFAVIGEELNGLYDKLAQRDLAAGSADARRLFS
jgi:hypothetical protein